MSKNVKILEDSTEKVLQSVSKIQTNLSNGSKCNWIPADSVPLGTLTVTEDGVYKASEDENGPYYGYSQVNVSGVGNVVMGTLGELTVTENGTYEAVNDASGPYLGYSKVTVNVPKDSTWHASSGTVGKDDDGDDAIATVNPETGEIEVEKLVNGLPVRIEVTTPPDVTTYGHGAYIGFEGLVVTAYCANDEPFDTASTPDGVIPIEQLEFPVTVAQYDEDAYVGMKYVDFSDAPTFPRTGTDLRVTRQNDGVWLEYGVSGGSVNTMYIFTQTAGSRFATVQTASSSDFTATYHSQEKNGLYYSGTIATSSYTYNNKTVYYTAIGSYTDYKYPNALPDKSIPDAGTFGTAPGEVGQPKIAWIMVYGEPDYSNAVQIPVKWQAPGSAGKLETSFGIEVLPPPSGTND